MYDIKHPHRINTNNHKINAFEERQHTNNATNNHPDETSSLTELFHIPKQIYQPEKGVSMGSPISSTIAEIFLQHFEDIHIKQLLDMKNIIFYTHYVDDILIIYDTKRIHSNLINTYINKIHTDKKLNPTQENNGCISFLDVFISRKPSNLETDIFCKTTTTDTTNNFFSNHSTQHKVAAFRYHITRMHSLPLMPERKQKEWTLIQLITQNNNFPKKLLQKLNFQIQHKQTNQDQINLLAPEIDI
jgi:hypothetical protein